MRPRTAKLIVGALALLAAASPSLLRAAEPIKTQGNPPEPAFNRLHTYEEIAELDSVLRQQRVGEAEPA